MLKYSSSYRTTTTYRSHNNEKAKGSYPRHKVRLVTNQLHEDLAQERGSLSVHRRKIGRQGVGGDRTELRASLKEGVTRGSSIHHVQNLQLAGQS